MSSRSWSQPSIHEDLQRLDSRGSLRPPSLNLPVDELAAQEYHTTDPLAWNMESVGERLSPASGNAGGSLHTTVPSTDSGGVIWPPSMHIFQEPQWTQPNLPEQNIPQSPPGDFLEPSRLHWTDEFRTAYPQHLYAQLDQFVPFDQENEAADLPLSFLNSSLLERPVPGPFSVPFVHGFQHSQFPRGFYPSGSPVGSTPGQFSGTDQEQYPWIAGPDSMSFFPSYVPPPMGPEQTASPKPPDWTVHAGTGPTTTAADLVEEWDSLIQFDQDEPGTKSEPASVETKVTPVAVSATPTALVPVIPQPPVHQMQSANPSVYPAVGMVPTDDGRHRNHPLYGKGPHPDGLYHCPFAEEAHCEQQHPPIKLKCQYDKYIDSHIKPFRCRAETCANAVFSSTACLLRHEREAHAMHGYGANPHLCFYPGCERQIRGFPRRYNLFDHMKRVHQHVEGGSSRASAVVRRTGRKHSSGIPLHAKSAPQR